MAFKKTKEFVKGITPLQWVLIVGLTLVLWNYTIRWKNTTDLVNLDKEDLSRDEKIDFILRNNGAEVVVDDNSSSFDGADKKMVYDPKIRKYVLEKTYKPNDYVIEMFHSANGNSNKIYRDEKGTLDGERLAQDLTDLRSKFNKMSDEEVNQAFDIVRYRLINKKQKLNLSDIFKNLKMDVRKKGQIIKNVIPALKTAREVNRAAKKGIKNNRRLYRKGTRKDRMNSLQFKDTEEGRRAKELFNEKFKTEGEVKDLLWLLRQKGYDYTIIGRKDTGDRAIKLKKFNGIGISTSTTAQQDQQRIHDLFSKLSRIKKELKGLRGHYSKGNNFQDRGGKGRSFGQSISDAVRNNGGNKDKRQNPNKGGNRGGRGNSRGGRHSNFDSLQKLLK